MTVKCEKHPDSPFVPLIPDICLNVCREMLIARNLKDW
jgi:hypothetical protein